MLRVLWRVMAALLLATRLSAQSNPPSAPGFVVGNPLFDSGRNITVSLLTMGDGDEVWELFGHTAIWLHDDVSGADAVFNWGVFDRSQPLFIPHFLKGLMLYQMGAEPLESVLSQYRYLNRSVVSQQLALNAAQKDTLLRLIQLNARPENLQYRYDYFVNNCSTRPRDLLDRALGGQIRAKSMVPSGTSYRWHALRLMQGNKPLVLGADIGLGEPSDREITKWQTMFLPQQLHDVVGALQVRDSSGMLHPLVANERVLFQATRLGEPTAPPNLAPWLWGSGLVIAAILVWLATASDRGSHAARVGLAVLAIVWCTAAGLLGTLLTLLWTVTDHMFAHHNENLLLFNPLWLILAVLAGKYVLRPRATRATWYLAFGLAALCVLALVAHAVTLSKQANLAVIGLALPPALAIAWIVRPRAPQA